jgi:RNA-directed DNA polymerase
MGVSERTKQVGEADAEILKRWAWVEASIWTPRMLTALEKGVKGDKWFSLIDKVYSGRNLEAAYRKVAANKGAPGIDRVTIEMFGNQLEQNLEKIGEQLRAERYQPQTILRKWIPKPGSKENRPLGIPTVRDRVVQAALVAAIGPVFERNFAEHSYGFRPGKGSKAALGRVDELLKAGNTYVVDADLRSYFDTIPHARLLKQVETRISDGRVLKLIEGFLKQSVHSGRGIEEPERGTPQGGVLSPLLANIYLDPLDQLMANQGWEMVRYADDFVILCRSEAEARAALSLVEQWTADAGLELHPEKTQVIDATQEGGFDFLGYHFERGYKWPRKKSLRKLKDRLRDQTRRTNGESLKTIIHRVNLTLGGWFEYFKHSHKTTFPSIDKWLRMRLRSTLRKREGRKGRGRGNDHQRWPIAFFDTQGLINLSTRHAYLRSILNEVNH